jgi:hypothetical protein
MQHSTSTEKIEPSKRRPRGYTKHKHPKGVPNRFKDQQLNTEAMEELADIDAVIEEASLVVDANR